MAKKPDKRKRDDPEQSKRCEKTARDVDALGEGKEFESALKKV